MFTYSDDHELGGALGTNEKTSEVLFGLIMTLTITGSLSVAEAGRAEVRTVLLAALGCNIAWGLIDALMYLMGCLNERGRSIRLLKRLHRTPDVAEGCKVVRQALPDAVQNVMHPEELDVLRQQLLRLQPAGRKPWLTAQEWLGALQVFALVFASAIPVVAPFALMQNVHRAMRTSNAIALLMLFAAGWAYGRSTGLRPWASGLVMVLIGCGLVAITIALGG